MYMFTLEPNLSACASAAPKTWQAPKK